MNSSLQSGVSGNDHTITLPRASDRLTIAGFVALIAWGVVGLASLVALMIVTYMHLVITQQTGKVPLGDLLPYEEVVLQLGMFLYVVAGSITGGAVGSKRLCRVSHSTL